MSSRQSWVFNMQILLTVLDAELAPCSPAYSLDHDDLEYHTRGFLTALDCQEIISQLTQTQAPVVYERYRVELPPVHVDDQNEMISIAPISLTPKLSITDLELVALRCVNQAERFSDLYNRYSLARVAISLTAHLARLRR